MTTVATENNHKVMVQKPEKYTEQFNFLDEKLLIVLNSKECKL